MGMAMDIRNVFFFIVSLLFINQQVHATPELMFFQHAAMGSIRPISHQAKCYEMTLIGLDSHVIYFSEAPNRISGDFNIKHFLETWAHDAKDGSLKPNAILHAHNAKNQQEVNDIAILSHPVFQAKDNSIQYTACPIKPNTFFKQMALQDVDLFIDPFHRWPP